MSWASWADFWAMGGYGLFVWGSFGVTALALILELWQLRMAGRDSMKRLRRLEQWEQSE
jgi:heme exporter protein D